MDGWHERSGSKTPFILGNLGIMEVFCAGDGTEWTLHRKRNSCDQVSVGTVYLIRVYKVWYIKKPSL